MGAVVVQRQAERVNILFVVVFLIVYAMAFAVGASGLIGAAVAGGVAGLVMAIGLRTIVVVRTPTSVLLARCRQLSSSVESIEQEIPVPVGLEIKQGMMNSKASFAGETFSVPKLQEGRLRELLQDDTINTAR